MVQKLKFGIYDIDNKTIDLSDDDFLGELECTLGQVRASLASSPCAYHQPKRFVSHLSCNYYNLQRKKWNNTSMLQMKIKHAW